MKFFCPQCGQKLACNDDEQGTVVSCPNCANAIAVPSANPLAVTSFTDVQISENTPPEAYPAKNNLQWDQQSMQYYTTPHQGVSIQNPQQPMTQQIQINVTAPESQLKINPLSRGVYLILAFFFGCFGIHNFYSGHAGSGIFKILLTVCSLGLLSPFVFFWVILEMIFIDEDSHGIKFR